MTLNDLLTPFKPKELCLTELSFMKYSVESNWGWSQLWVVREAAKKNNPFIWKDFSFITSEKMTILDFFGEFWGLFFYDMSICFLLKLKTCIADISRKYINCCLLIFFLFFSTMSYKLLILPFSSRCMRWKFSSLMERRLWLFLMRNRTILTGSGVQVFLWCFLGISKHFLILKV